MQGDKRLLILMLDTYTYIKNITLTVNGNG